MKTLIPVIILTLTACQTIRHAEINGEKVHEVTCNGTSRSYMDCAEEASKYCAKENKKMIQMNQEANSAIIPIGNSFASGVYRSMMFKCEEMTAKN